MKAEELNIGDIFERRGYTEIVEIVNIRRDRDYPKPCDNMIIIRYKNGETHKMRAWYLLENYKLIKSTFIFR